MGLYLFVCWSSLELFISRYFTFLYQIPHKKRLLWETLSPIAKHCCGSPLPAIQTIPTALCLQYLLLSWNNGLIVILAAVLGDYGRGEIVNKGITLVPSPAQPSPAQPSPGPLTWECD